MLYRTLKVLYASALYFVRCFRWYCEYYCIRYGYLKRIKDFGRTVKELDISSMGNVLIVVPHADDDLIGNYSIFTRAANVTIYYIGEYPIKNNELTQRRDKELKRFAADNQAEIVTCGNISHSDKLSQVITENRIATVFTPNFVDWHTDHQNASKFLLDALAGIDIKPRIFCYYITVPKPFSQDAFYLPFCKEQQRTKWKAFNNYYVSQRFMPVKRFILQEQLNAIGIPGVHAAELFTEMTYDELIIECQRRPSGYDREMIKNMIDNIKAIRSYSDSLKR